MGRGGEPGAADRAEALLCRLAGAGPDVVWQSPGRANLIGEHTDYNGGWALPFAVDRRTAVAARRRPAPGLRAWSAQEPGLADPAAGWGRYVHGAVLALAEAGVEVPGADLVIDSDLPVGAGLSSSAALLISVAGVLAALAGVELEPALLAAVAHRAETVHAGVPVGWLDHLAVAHARAGHASLIDFDSLDLVAVPLAIGPLAIVDTGVRHDNAAGGYRRRREECSAAAGALGLGSLRFATPDAVESVLEGDLRRRARHVVSEDARVLSVVARLRAGEGIGEILVASHASLRDDFDASCPELDVAVDTVLSAGSEGARMMGGGFGGSALVLGLAVAELDAALRPAFAARGWRPPRSFEVVPAGGPGPV